MFKVNIAIALIPVFFLFAIIFYVVAIGSCGGISFCSDLKCSANRYRILSVISLIGGMICVITL